MKFIPSSQEKSSLDLRKKAHIEFALEAQTSAHSLDTRFNYEPLFFKHPTSEEKIKTSFLGFEFDFPFWISSMTGGTEKARDINSRLATLCAEFNLGMGLGSCRSLLTSNDRFDDFNLRPKIGDRPFFANIGIAQLEQYVWQGKSSSIHEVVARLEATGLIVHINPLQEWFQKEGDQYLHSPLETLSKFLENVSYPVIVKEVGQGFGPKSLLALLKLPLAAVELSAFGGTNFSLLEKLRHESSQFKSGMVYVGHSNEEMIDFLNTLPLAHQNFIISGGIQSPLDAFYYSSKLKAPSVIGMAQLFLGPAQMSYEVLRETFLEFKNSFLVAKKILTVKGDQ